MIYNNIIIDFMNVLRYLPYTLYGVFLALLLYPYYRYKKYKLSNWFAFLLLSTYFCMVLAIALFSREPGSRTGMDLIPFSTWTGESYGNAFVVENVLFFIPYGLFIHLAIPSITKFKYYIFIFFLSSLLIETTQFITQRGYFQTDDIIMNTLGGIIGVALYFYIIKMKEYLNRI